MSLKSKTASIITDLVIAKQVLAPLSIVSCDTVGITSKLVPGAPILIAVAKESGNPSQPAASIDWGSADQDPLDLVDEVQQDIALFMGHQLHDSPRPLPPATILLSMTLRQFVRLTQEVYGETMRCLQPFAHMAKLAQTVQYRGALYRQAAQVTTWEDGLAQLKVLGDAIVGKVDSKGGKQSDEKLMVQILTTIDQQMKAIQKTIGPLYEAIKNQQYRDQLKPFVQQPAALVKQYQALAEKKDDGYQTIKAMLPRVFALIKGDKTKAAQSVAALQKLQESYGTSVNKEATDPIYPRLGKMIEIITQMSKLGA